MTDIFKGAHWIWQKDSFEVNAHIDLSAKFFTYTGREYYFCVSADSNYALYIDDRFIESGQFPDYHEYKVYDRINITPYVASGENQLHLIGYCQNEDSSTYRKGKPGVIFSVLERNVDEEASILVSNENILAAKSVNYLSAGVEKITGQLSYSFRYDATKTRVMSVTEKACIVDGMPEKLYPRPVKKLEIQPNIPTKITAVGTFMENGGNTCAEKMQLSYLAYKPLPSVRRLPCEAGVKLEYPDGDGIYTVIDTGAENVGFISLDFEVENECDVFIGWGEHLEDMRIRTSVGGRNFAALYRAKAGRNTFLYPLKRSGLRYMSLHFYTHSVNIHYIGIRPTVYPVSKVPYFKCADTLHNKIYDISRRTLLMSMHDHYEDCPWREQALYTMDSRNQMLCGYYVFGEYDFPKASLRLLSLAIRDDDQLELCSPARVPVVIPSFSDMFIVQLHEYLLYSGDIEFIKEMLPTAKRIADGFIKRTSENGLQTPLKEAFYWNFYEWSNGLSGAKRGYTDEELTYDAPLCAYCSLAYNALSEMYRITGEEELAAYYANERDKINEKANEFFWDENEGAYYSFVHASTGKAYHLAELTQALMVSCGACPEPRLSKVLKTLVSPDARFVPVTISHSIFKYDALMKKPMLYASAVFRSVADIWGNMLYNGATTFYETADGADAFGYAGSLCHGWSAVPSYLYFKYLLGISPDKNGTASHVLAPVCAGIYDPCGKVLFRDGSDFEL